MKLLNLFTGVFCLYGFISKLNAFVFYESNTLEFFKNIPEYEEISEPIFSSFEYAFIIIWGLVFFILFLLWVWANVKKKKSMKIFLSAFTIVFSLFMNITDNFGSSFYINEKITGGELLE